MPRNVYFSQTVRSEQNLYEDLIVEALKIYSQDVYYIPRHMLSRDMILNEAVESRFEDAYMIEMYLESVDGFDGDGTLFTKFGLEIRDQATFVVAKRTWEKLVGLWNNTIVSGRPNEGDLIYLPLSKSFMEIKFVDHQQPFYQLSKFPVYKLRCENFEYSNEEVNTGIAEVDALQRSSATEYVFEIDNSNGTNFIIGEYVRQTLVSSTSTTAAVEVYAKVLRFEKTSSTDTLKIYLGGLTSNTGKFELFKLTEGVEDQLTGDKSGAAWDITKIYDIATVDSDKTFVNNNQQGQNYDFEQQANDIIDFTEHNPFGEPSITPVTSVTRTSYTADSSTITSDSTHITADVTH